MEHLGSEGNNSKPTIGSGGGGSDSQTDGSSSGYAIRGRRLSQQFSASAYLVPAFNACATGPNSNGSSPTDVDASLLRYTRPHLFSNSSSSDERPLLRQFLHLRPSLGSSDSSLSPAGMTPTPPGRSPTVFCTPAKGAVLEDGVLVINDDPQGDNRVCHAATRRLLAVGPCSGNSNTNNVRSGGGGGYLHRVQGRRSFDDEGYAMDYQVHLPLDISAFTSPKSTLGLTFSEQMMGWLSNASQIKQFSRNRPLPSPSPVTNPSIHASSPDHAEFFYPRLLHRVLLVSAAAELRLRRSVPNVRH